MRDKSSVTAKPTQTLDRSLADWAVRFLRTAGTQTSAINEASLNAALVTGQEVQVWLVLKFSDLDPISGALSPFFGLAETLVSPLQLKSCLERLG